MRFGLYGATRIIYRGMTPDPVAFVSDTHLRPCWCCLCLHVHVCLRLFLNIEDHLHSLESSESSLSGAGPLHGQLLSSLVLPDRFYSSPIGDSFIWSINSAMKAEWLKGFLVLPLVHGSAGRAAAASGISHIATTDDALL